MEKGLIFAILSAICFAGSTVFIRRGVSKIGESFTAVVVSLSIGLPFFAASAFFSGEWDELWSFSWLGIVALGAAGIIHFVAGRLFFYNSYRLIGANKASAISRTTPFYTLAFGLLFLNESITTSLILGVLCIFTGAILVSTERKSVSKETGKGFSKTEVKGILTALGGAACWGISPVIIRAVVKGASSPSAAALVSYVAASIVVACLFSRRQHREQVVQLHSFKPLIPLIIAGIFVSVAQLLNYAALIYTPANTVVPLLGTSVLFVFLFSFFLNRNIEVFTLKVTLGLVATVIGTYLICR